MLNLKQRIKFVSLTVFLLLAGLAEMSTILLIFGFVQGLGQSADGERTGRLIKLIELFTDKTFSHDQYLLYVGGGVLLALIAKNLFVPLVEFTFTRFLMKLNQRVSEDLFRGYLLAPYEYLRENNVVKQIDGAFNLFSICFGATSQVIVNGATGAMIVLLLAFVDPVLTASAVVMLAVAGGGLYRAMQVTLRKMGQKESAAHREGIGYLSDGLEGAAETRLRDAREFMRGGYRRALARTALVQRRSDGLKRLPKAVNEITLAVFLVGSVWRLSSGGANIADSLSTLTIFGFGGIKLSGLASRLNKGFQRLRLKVDEFEEQCAAIRTVAPHVLQDSTAPVAGYLRDEIPLPAGVKDLMTDRLSLRNVSYTYRAAQTPAVLDLTLDIRRGEFVGICGTSGGGKSTLLLLLLGLIRPESGDILCDGLNLHHHIRKWYSKIGYVSQDLYLARRSIRENIAFAVLPEKIDDNRVWECLRMASAEDFVRALPEGLNTPLIGQGRNFSGGQRQRLVIARALYADPKVLFFDEATAALDNATEHSITSELQKLRADKTLVVIAHRLSTLRNCDVIHVLSEGKLCGSGTYEELLQTNPEFQRLHRPEGPIRGT